MDKLERKQAEELALLLEERERRHEQEPIRYYNQGDKKHLKQIEFHQSPKRIRALFGGNRCIAGESMIYDPVKQEYREVQTITEDFHVYAWDDKKKALVVARALKPFHHEDIDDLYDFTLNNGKTFTASLNHRVLDEYGLYRQLDQCPVGCALFHPPSIQGRGPLVHALNVQRLIQKSQDSQCGCRHESRLCDEQLRHEKENVLSTVPSQERVQTPLYRVAYEREDDPDNKRIHNHAYRTAARPSSLGAQAHCEDRYVASRSYAFCKFLRCSGSRTQFDPQPTYGYAFRPQSSAESAQFVGRKDSAHCTLTCNSSKNVLFVISISYNRRDYKWDFTVPNYENYYMAGVIHHNTGKTVGGAVEGVWYATGEHPYKKDLKPYINRPNRGWVVSLTNEVQRDVAQKEILKWLRPDQILDVVMRVGAKTDIENGVIDLLQVRHVSGGVSTIGFKTVEQGREKFQGTSQHWIWFDEEPPKEIYDECLMRLLDTQGDFWLTMTPLKGLTWAYDLIYENRNNNPEVQYWQMEWADNPFLSRSEIAYLESTLLEEEREARQYGRFIALSGLVYPEFDPNIHVIKPFDVPKGWYDKISIDPGYTAPLSCHWYACDDEGTIYAIAEHYVKEKRVEWHASEIKKKSRGMEWPFTYNDKLLAVMDSAATQKTVNAEQTTAELFTQHGVIPSFVNKDVWVGIQRIKQYLALRPLPDDHPEKDKWPKGKPKFFITTDCPEMIKEFKTYRWEESRDGEPVERPQKKKDHAMDDARYYVMSRPSPFEAEQEQLKGCFLLSELLDKGYTRYQIKKMESTGQVRILG